MPYGLTTLKDRATQLLKKYKSGALVAQFDSSTDDFSNHFQNNGCSLRVLHSYDKDIAILKKKLFWQINLEKKVQQRKTMKQQKEEEDGQCPCLLSRDKGDPA